MSDEVDTETINSVFQLFFIFFVMSIALISLVGVSIIKNMESRVRYSLNYFKPIIQGDPINAYQKIMGISLILILGIYLKYRNKSVPNY